MKKVSAGLLMYKFDKDKLLVFIGHHGGPYYKNKDESAWDIPKGEAEKGEEILKTAKREFKEEVGIIPPEDTSKYLYLDPITRKDGKTIHIWAFEGDWSGLLLGKSFVTLEYPAGSGRKITFPEIDKAGFFDIETAKKKLWPHLHSFIDQLVKIKSK